MSGNSAVLVLDAELGNGVASPKDQEEKDAARDRLPSPGQHSPQSGKRRRGSCAPLNISSWSAPSYVTRSSRISTRSSTRREPSEVANRMNGGSRRGSVQARRDGLAVLFRPAKENLARGDSSSEDDDFCERMATRRKMVAEADVQPVDVNWSVDWEHVGGLQHQVDILKECILHPLLYADLYESMGVKPPRGVLLHGQPGCGKTLVVRALAGECRTSGLPITFFARKGSDLQSKWVGEAERRVCTLFEVAQQRAPSIIFFDEVDGLAPHRSQGGEDASHHNAVVTTLLACMDGLVQSQKVAIVAATNRPDLLDSALRRPGRFDREVYFPPPDASQRRHIMQVLTRKWPAASKEPGIGGAASGSIARLVESTAGFSGADLHGLCNQAAICSIRRACPQIYRQSAQMPVSADSIQVTEEDFKAALASHAATARSASIAKHLASDMDVVEVLRPSQLAAEVSPLYGRSAAQLCKHLALLFPPWGASRTSASSSSQGLSRQSVDAAQAWLGAKILVQASCKRLLQAVEPVMFFGAEMPVFRVHLDGEMNEQYSICSMGARILRAVRAAVAAAPGVLLLSNLQDVMRSQQVTRVLRKALAEVPPEAPIMVVGTLVLSRPSDDESDAPRGSAREPKEVRAPPPFRATRAATRRKTTGSPLPPKPQVKSAAWDDWGNLVDSFQKLDVASLTSSDARSFFQHILSQGACTVLESILIERVVQEPATSKIEKVLLDPAEQEEARVQALSEEQLLMEEQDEEHWFRLLRQQVREILRSLVKHARFAPFARPAGEMRALLQPKTKVEGPLTLLELIESNDAGQYTSVKDVQHAFDAIKHNAQVLFAAEDSLQQQKLRAVACEMVDAAENKLSSIDRCVASEAARLSERRARRLAAQDRLQAKDSAAPAAQKRGPPGRLIAKMAPRPLPQASPSRARTRSRSKSPLARRGSQAHKDETQGKASEAGDGIVRPGSLRLPGTMRGVVESAAKKLSEGLDSKADDDAWLDRVLELGRIMQESIYHAALRPRSGGQAVRERLKVLTDKFDRCHESKAVGYSQDQAWRRLAAFERWCSRAAIAAEAEQATSQFVDQVTKTKRYGGG